NADHGEGTVNNIDSSSFNSAAQAAINMSSVTGATFDHLNINGNGGPGGVQAGINGQNVSNLTLSNSTVTGFGDESNESVVMLWDLTGTSSITNSTFGLVPGDTTGGTNLVDIRGDTGTLTLNVTGSTFQNTRDSTNGSAGIIVTSVSNQTVNLNVSNSDFLNLKTSGVETIARDTSTMNVNITDGGTTGNGNVFDPQGGLMRAIGLNTEDTAHQNFNINRNGLIKGSGGPIINVFGINNAVIHGRIDNNSNIQGGGDGAAGSPINIHPEDNSAATVDVSNNAISQVGNDPGIFGTSHGDGQTALSATLDLTIHSNTIAIASTNPGGVPGIDTRAGANNGDTIKTCVDVANN